ncbi:unnamed protein product [Amoebophrya sp. A120]|nr:unnamed protein product [Amoebophrya sp. A120]|eukprot:GSA120T00016035001.1
MVPVLFLPRAPCLLRWLFCGAGPAPQAAERPRPGPYPASEVQPGA